MAADRSYFYIHETFNKLQEEHEYVICVVKISTSVMLLAASVSKSGAGGHCGRRQILLLWS